MPDVSGDNGFESSPFEIRYEDYAALLAARPYWKLRGRKAHITVIGAALFNIGCSLVFLKAFDGPFFQTHWLNWINACLGVGILVLSYVVRPIQQRRVYKATTLAGARIVMRLDGKAIHSSRPGVVSNVDWSQVMGWSDDGERLFFWINKLTAFVLPKRALSAASVSGVMKLIDDHGLKKL